jgi:hypothetical protein
MVLNASKTKVLLVTGKRMEKKLSDTELKITVSGKEIEQVASQKLLGVKLDKNLDFNEHIDDLCKKVSQRIGVLKQIKRNLPIEERKLYYNAMIKPLVLYGSCVWSSTSSDNIDRIYKLQKRAARVILDADTTVRSASLFSKLQWLPLKKEIMVQKFSLIFKRIIGESPRYIVKLFPRNADLTNRASRHGKHNLVCPRYNRESEGGRTFQISGIKLWNSIPIEIRKKETIGTFKSALKKYLLS